MACHTIILLNELRHCISERARCSHWSNKVVYSTLGVSVYVAFTKFYEAHKLTKTAITCITHDQKVKLRVPACIFIDTAFSPARLVAAKPAVNVSRDIKTVNSE